MKLKLLATLGLLIPLVITNPVKAENPAHVEQLLNTGECFYYCSYKISSRQDSPTVTKASPAARSVLDASVNFLNSLRVYCF